MKYTYCLLFITNCCLAQDNKSHEQIVFTYFFENVFRTEHEDVHRIEFSGQAEAGLSRLYHLKMCLPEGDALRFKLDSVVANQVLPKSQINYSQVAAIRFTKIHKNSNRIKLHVLQATPLADKRYVVIHIYKPYHFVEYFLFEMNGKGEIIRYCKTGEII